MAIRASSLNEFLKLYRREKERASGPETFEDFIRRNGDDHVGKHTAAVKAALSERARAGGGYGAEGERLGSAGLNDDGYRSFLEGKADRRLSAKIGVADEEMADDYRTSLGGYERYLEEYNPRRDEKIEKVRTFLLENNIYSLETSFNVGISEGLSANEAAELSAELYSIRRDEIFANVFRKLLIADMNDEAIKEYGRSMGLIEDDVARLVDTTKKFQRQSGFTVPEEYIEYLEQLGAKQS